MITTLLYDQARKELARAEEPTNGSYLITQQVNDMRYPLLSQLDNCSYTVFDSSDMEQLINELELLKPNLTQEQNTHVDQIIYLAHKCQDNMGYYLVFTPFSAFLDHPIETYKLAEAKTIT